MATKRKFTSEFKTKIVIGALKEQKTISELSSIYDVHSQLITNWKKEFLSKSSSVFDKDSGSKTVQESEKETEFLYAQIGQLKVENEY